MKYPEPSIRRADRGICAGTGLGRELLRGAIAACHQAFPGLGICISAQHRLERFYVNAGFVAVGEPYPEDELPHIEMLRSPP